jgi:hypothetical protein
MGRYRYRTPALAGPWRSSPDEALEDAARARQVRIEGAGPKAVTWVVPGEIEEDVPRPRAR